MKTMKKISAALLAGLALAVFSVPSQAQTTNWMVYNFDTNQVANKSGFPWSGPYQGWNNWFGNAWVSGVWDSSADSSNNPSSGSMKITTTWLPKNPGNNYYQYCAFDGFSDYNADMYNTFTNLSFDVKYGAGSCTRTNDDGTVDFGAMRVGAWDNYGQDWLQYFAIPATNALGGPNTDWTHISVTIDTNTFLQYPALVNIQNIVFGMDGGDARLRCTNMNGTQTVWLDNIQFIGPAGGIVHPPPTLSVARTTPGLRAFIGSASIYARSQLTSINANQSWIGGTYPVTYSFTLLDFPNVSQVQAHLELIPGPAYTGNAGADYGNTNCLWLQILSSGTGGYTANVAWKTNAVNKNPNDGTVGHTVLSIASPNSPAGTWTLTFTNATSGTLSGPGTNNVPFTINDPNLVADWQNPCMLVIGNQPNGVSVGEGLPSDYSAISVTGVAAGDVNDNFTTAASLDPVWSLSNCDKTNTVVLVTTNSPYWVYWTLPDTGFGLGVATNVTCDPLILPEFYNGYFDVPLVAAQGKMRWTLIPSDCLPTVNGLAQYGQPLAPNAFFRLSNPPPPF